MAKTLYDMLQSESTAVESTGEYNLNTGEGQTWGDYAESLITPQYNIPGLSAMSRAIGSAAKAIDEAMPDIPLSAAIATQNPVAGLIARQIIPDVNVPGATVLANFTPGIGDPETGLYSPVDVVGAALDATGAGYAVGKGVDALRTTKISGTRRAFRIDDTNRQEIMDRSVAQTNQMLNEMRNRVATPHDLTPIPRAMPQSVVDHYAGHSDEIIRSFNEQLASGASIDDALRTASRAPRKKLPLSPVQKTLDQIPYENFNITKLNRLDTQELGIERVFIRNDKSKSEFTFQMNQVENNLSAIRTTDPSGAYLNYNIATIEDGSNLLRGINLFPGNILPGGGYKAGARIGAVRLSMDMLNQVPLRTNLIAGIRGENSLNMDSLTMVLSLINKSETAKITRAGKRGLTAEAPISVFSKASKLGEAGKTEELQKLFDAHQRQLIDSGKMNPEDAIDFNVTEVHRVSAGSTDKITAQVTYTPFTVEDFKAFAPVALGFKDWEEMTNRVNDIDDVVESVMELEKGIFND